MEQCNYTGQNNKSSEHILNFLVEKKKQIRKTRYYLTYENTVIAFSEYINIIKEVIGDNYKNASLAVGGKI